LRRFPPAETGGPATRQPLGASWLSPLLLLPRLTYRCPFEAAVTGLLARPLRFPASVPLLFPAAKIATTCPTRLGPVPVASCLRRMHRQAGCVSARFCGLPHSRFCCAVLFPYPQTASPRSGHLCPEFGPDPPLSCRARRRSLGRLAALLLCGLIRILLSLTGVRLRPQQPKVSPRFRGYQPSALFHSGTLGWPRVELALRLALSDQLRIPDDVSLISASRL